MRVKASEVIDRIGFSTVRPLLFQKRIHVVVILRLRAVV
jgi:hypothetical protein